VNGDFSHVKLKAAVKKSHIIGDVVAHYLRIAPNKLGVTFTDSVETATEVATRFNEAGVPAAVVSAKTPDSERIAILKKFKNRQLLQLVNVDLFGEGFDLPAIEVVGMARATESYALYVQQFGRALRLLDGKTFAIIIDHVGNVTRHGLPDAPRTWTLERRDKKSKGKSDDSIPVTACPSCTAVYERIYKACPFCGHISAPAGRSAPEQVDGDLIELDAAALAVMRGEIDAADQDLEAFRAALKDKEVYRSELAASRVPLLIQLANVKRFVAKQEAAVLEHKEAQAAQVHLREALAWWGGYQRALKREDSESYRRFYFKFGVDVWSAQSLGSVQALDLLSKINKDLEGIIK